VRHWLLAALVLALALLIARAPAIKPTFKAEALAGAREMVVYRLEGSPARFDVPAGQRMLRVLTNLDLPAAPPPDGEAYSVRVRIPEDGRDEVFPLVAMARRRANGTPAAFSLGGAVPGWTREVMVTRPQTTAATLEVSLVAPARARGAVRVLATAHRTPLAVTMLAKRSGPAERAKLAGWLGPLDWDELPAALQAELLTTHWTRLPASPATPRGRLYVTGQPAPVVKPASPPGEAVEAGQVLAYTVRGPGTLRFVAVEEALEGSIHLLSAAGQEQTIPLALKVGERVDLPLAAGLVTARLRALTRGRVLALAADARLALPGTSLQGRADGEWELHPAWTFERYPVAAAGLTAPVVYDLRGRDEAELRLTAYALTRCDHPPSELRVLWTIKDAAAKVLAGGTLRQVLAPACEDRLDGDEGTVPSEPLAAYLWPPAGAASLEVTGAEPALLSVASPAFDQPLEAPPPAGLAPNVAVRHQPADRPLWLRVRALNEDEIARTGRLPLLRLATRIERRPPPVPPSQLAETLAPVDQPPRITMLVPAKADAPAPDRGGWWPITAGAPASVNFAPPPGAGAGARVPFSLLFLGDEAAARGEAVVRIDGVTATRTPLYTARGQIALPPAPAGRRVVQIDAPGRARLFVDHPTGGAAPYRAFSAYELQVGRPSVVRVAKPSAPRALGVVLYFDGAPGPHARLRVVIDRGRRTAPRGGVARARTRLVRTLPLTVAPLPGGVFLNRTTPAVLAAAPLFVGLEDDLPAGGHTLTLTLERTRVRAFARYFSYNGSLRPERVSGFGEARSSTP
jgi:hypothetical protein